MVYDVIPVTSPKQTDCGATCLKMLLAYYGQDISLEQLTRECNTSLIGCSAKDLIRVGKTHTLDMKAYEMDADELLRQDRPAIVWWMYNHFVVFCGVDANGKAVICNPNSGKYRVSRGNFRAFYTKVALFNGEPHDVSEQ